MAGGGGTRLWPLSRKARPKQMLRLIDERSLFQTAVQRLWGLFTPDQIFVVTVADQAAELQAQCPEIPIENYLLEPAPRGTASVIGLAAVALQQRDPQAVMAVLTSDHYIGNEAQFRQILRAAQDAANDDYLVTLGIDPTHASTAYGYIQRGEMLGRYQEFDAYTVLRFCEKPDAAVAEDMLAAGDHDWNSGMFIWKVERILAEFRLQMPELAAQLGELAADWGTPRQQATLDRIWPRIRPQTIDYGIMEHARRVAVLPAVGLEWSDVGSWDSLFEILPSDESGNIVIGGKHFGLDTRQSLVYVNQEHRLIVTIGVEDLVVVDTGDVLLICKKDQAQRVRQVVDDLKKSGQNYV